MTFLDQVSGSDLAYPRGFAQAGIVMDLQANNNQAYQAEDDAGEIWTRWDTSTSDHAVYWGGTDLGPGASGIKFRWFVRDEEEDAWIVSDDDAGQREYIHIDTRSSGDGEKVTFGNAVTNPLYEFLGTNDIRISSQVRLAESATPTAVGGHGFVYVKDVSGRSELFYHDDLSTETQITGPGGIGGTSLPFSLSGDDNVIVEDSGTNRAWLTADISSDQMVTGNATDDVNLVIESSGGGRLQFGEASANPIIITYNPTEVPTGNTAIAIGNLMDVAAGANNSVSIGHSIRNDGVQNVNIGATNDVRGSNDTVVGYGNSSTNLSGFNVIVGNGVALTGQHTIKLGRGGFDNATVGNVIIGNNATAASGGSQTVYFGSTHAATYPLRTIVFGTGGASDFAAGTQTYTIRPSGRGSLTDVGSIFRLDAAAATGDAGTVIEFFGAPTNVPSNFTATASSRMGHVEAGGANGSPIEYIFHVGDEGDTAAANASLYFEGATGTAVRQGIIDLEGSSGILTVSAAPGPASSDDGAELRLAGGTGFSASEDGGGVKAQYADANTLTTGLHLYGGIDGTASYPSGSIEVGRGIGATCRIIPISDSTSTSSFATLHSIDIASDRNVMIHAYIMGTRSAAADEGWASLEVFGGVHNDSGTTDEDGGAAFLATTSGTANRSGLAAGGSDNWDLRIIADDTNDQADIDVSGSDGKTVNWRGFLIVWEGV